MRGECVEQAIVIGHILKPVGIVAGILIKELFVVGKAGISRVSVHQHNFGCLGLSLGYFST